MHSIENIVRLSVSLLAASGRVPSFATRRRFVWSSIGQKNRPVVGVVVSVYVLLAFYYSKMVN